jgi:predicted O-methyltransferase YrrM
MRRFLRRIVPNSIRSYFHDLQHRVANLEMVVDVLISSPVYSPGDDVGFNGQLVRKQIFRDLIAAFPFEVILETGTWTGNTSAYMAQTARLPVHTCEANPRFHAVAKMRLANVSGVHFQFADSREFLEQSARSELASKFAFFYLDAHWYDDLPLAEELEIIERGWRQFVVMIDDFRVPGDDGYGYDNYGPNKALAIEYLADVMRTRNLEAFFPAVPSAEETGPKRGCVVITRSGELSQRLAGVASLRRSPISG